MSLGCRDFNDSLLDLAYGEVDGAAADRLREHAATCAACREALEGVLLTRKLAAQLPPVETADSGREELLSMARRAAAGFAADRESRPEAAPVAAGAAFVDRGPGLLDRLRAALLRPAFATAAAAGLVLAVALVLYQRDPAGTSEVESSAPFLGPIGAPQPRSQPREVFSPAPAAEGSVTGAPAAAGDRLEPAAAQAKRRASGPLGTGRGGGGMAPGDGAGLGTAGPVPARAGEPAPAVRPAPAKSAAEEEAGAGSDSWPDAKADGADLDTVVPAGSQAKTAAAPSSAEQPSAGAARDGETTYQSALAAYRRGDCSAAMPLFEKVVADPEVAAGTRASALHHLALCDKRAGRCSQAVMRYDALLDGYPGYGRRPEALWEAAACHRRLGDLAEARRRLVDLARYPAWRERAFEELRVIDDLGGGQP